MFENDIEPKWTILLQNRYLLYPQVRKATDFFQFYVVYATDVLRRPQKR